MCAQKAKKKKQSKGNGGTSQREGPFDLLPLFLEDYE